MNLTEDQAEAFFKRVKAANTENADMDPDQRVSYFLMAAVLAQIDSMKRAETAMGLIGLVDKQYIEALFIASQNIEKQVDGAGKALAIEHQVCKLEEFKKSHG